MFEEDGSLNVTYNLYILLKIRPPCSDEELTKAYRKLALKYHPDKASGSVDQFQQIKMAYDVLKDPLKREFYDRFGDSGIKFLQDDEKNLSGFGGTSTWLGRFVLKIATRPLRIIPIFFFIAFIGILFVLFLNFIDRKLYFSGLKDISWPFIFAMFWTIQLFFLSLQCIYVYTIATRFKTLLRFQADDDEIQKLSNPRRRFVAFMMVANILFSGVSGILFSLSTFCCTWILAFNLDDSNKLANGKTWSQVLEPFKDVLIVFVIIKLILAVCLVLRLNNPKRLWKERVIYLIVNTYSPISSLAFICYLSFWLDSSERDPIILLIGFSFLYVRVVIFVFQKYLETGWNLKENLEMKIYENNSNSFEEIEKNLKNQTKWTRILVLILAGFILLTIVPVHSHLLGYWPQSWSITFFPILICVFTSIFVFGFCCPCIATCMEMAIPVNSYDRFVFVPGEEQITIIEIPSVYRHGFGFAPFQHRIKHC